METFFLVLCYNKIENDDKEGKFMERQEFLDKFEKADKKVKKEYFEQSIQRSIEASMIEGMPVGHQNLIIAMEELSELAKEVSKHLRGRGDYYATVEELADALLMIAYIQQICDISDDAINKALNVKLNRLNDVLDKEGHYN